MIKINPDLNRSALATEFRDAGWVQVSNFLTESSANALLDLLDTQTPWGLAWQAGGTGPQYVSAGQLKEMSPQQHADRRAKLLQTRSTSAAYNYAYRSYSLSEPTHRRVLDDLNGGAFIDLLRTLTGDDGIILVDGQATLFAPGNAIAVHTDEVADEGRRVAYVLNLTKGEWRPEWGGYLNFFDANGNIERGLRPRFNTLNIFSVPRWHSVAPVAPEAPIARYAVTGWGRSKETAPKIL